METTVLISLSGQQLDDLITSSLRKALSHQTTQASDHGDDTLLDTKEAALLIKYKETSVYGLVKRKKIPFIKVDGYSSPKYATIPPKVRHLFLGKVRH